MNLSTLRSDTRFLIFGNSSDTNYSNTDLDRNLNTWYKNVLIWVLSANGHWQVNGERATTDLVADQREYILPIDIMKLNEVYIKTSADEDYVKAKQRDAKDFLGEPDDDSYTPDTPEFDLTDKSMFVYLPTGSIPSVTKGIKIHYQTEITSLSLSNDAPNLNEPFSRLLVYGAAYDYCLANELNNKGEKLKRDIIEMKNDLLTYYANKSTVKSVILEFEEKNFY